MAVEYWKANTEIYEMAKKLIASHHPDLALIDLEEIAIIFREKATKSGGVQVLGKSKKAPAILATLGTKEYKFIIELAHDAWLELRHSQREALVDHHLCACRVDEEDDGSLKCYIAKPDFMGFRDEIDRHGMWRPQPEEEERDVGPREQIDNLITSAVRRI